MPSSDTQSSGRESHKIDKGSSTEAIPVLLPRFSLPTTPPPSPLLRSAGISSNVTDNAANEFAAAFHDLAAGGLKTLTAKRELPPLLDRPTHATEDPSTTALSSGRTFVLVILICIMLMLVSGGVVLFTIMQP